MAASGSTSRAIYAGLSCGFVFAVPVAAYVATIPFSDANNTVTACALPFTVGALAGVGILSAVSAVGRHHAAAAAQDEAYAKEPGFGAAQGTAAFHDAEHHHGHEGVERFFGSRRVPKDVPVIARAQDALSEEEAWADIDSMLSEDSPISCDAATSKDIYQIALEELQREAAEAAKAAPAAGADAWSAPAAAASTWSTAVDVMAAGGAPAAAADVQAAPVAAVDGRRTVISPADTFIAASQAVLSEDASLGGAAAQAGAALYAPEPVGAAESEFAPVAAPAASVPDTTTVMRADDLAEPTAQVSASDEYDTGAAQQAALDSLDEIDGTRLQPRTPLVHLTAGEPVAPQRVAAASAAESAAVTPASYAGHEDMWAAALAVLAGEEPAPAESEQPAYVPRHLRRADAAAPALEAPSEAARAAAVAEGRRANEMHKHVNSLIEEELGKVSSSSVRRSSREYLRVIQGGTASMPRLKAEA